MKTPDTNQKPTGANADTSKTPPRSEEDDEFTGSLEASYIAATSGTGAITKEHYGEHPTKIYHAREETGRHADPPPKK